jgi:hypothetical protein
MTPSGSRATRVLPARLRERASAAGLPSYAPVPAAVAAAVVAHRSGASLDEAVEVGWSTLQTWAARWPAPAVAVTASAPTIRRATPAAG